MVFVITLRELKTLILVLIIGLFGWFFYSGFEEWVSSMWQLGPIGMMALGLLGFLAILFFFKSNVLRFIG